MKKKNIKKKNSQNNFSKLSVFQNQKYKFKKKCPLSGKGAPASHRGAAAALCRH